MKFYSRMQGRSKIATRQSTQHANVGIQAHGSGVTLEALAKTHRFANNRKSRDDDAVYTMRLDTGLIRNKALATIAYTHDRTNDARKVTFTTDLWALVPDEMIAEHMHRDPAFAQRLRALVFLNMDAAQ